MGDYLINYRGEFGVALVGTKQLRKQGNGGQILISDAVTPSDR